MLEDMKFMNYLDMKGDIIPTKPFVCERLWNDPDNFHHVHIYLIYIVYY